MEKLKDIKAYYVKAIKYTVWEENDQIRNFTEKQQKILNELFNLIEDLKSKNFDSDCIRNKVNDQIDSTANRFAKDVYNLLSEYDCEDMDRNYNDGRYEKDNRTYYEVAIPNGEYDCFSYIGLTEDSFFLEKF